MRRPVLTLLLLSFLTFFLGLGRQAITDSDEAYYAEAAREMVESRDWLTPHFNYEDRWEKPILYYWLTAATYRVAGPTEWAARFWSALSGLGLVLLTYGAARRLSGRDDTAWLAGAIVATCFGCFAEARMALPDLPLTLCITLGIWAAVRATDAAEPVAGRRRWWMAAGLAAGLGFLMKGPVALAVPAVVLLPIWWRERQSVAVDRSGVAVAALVFACVGFPWYVAMWREHGAAYLQSFFVGDNLERFATGRFNDRRIPGLYLLIAIGGLMPWSAFLLPTVRAALDGLRRRLHPGEAEWRLLLWAGMPLLFFTISVGQQPRYILPALPPLAILLARSLRREVDDAAAGRPSAALRVATWMTAGIFIAIALFFVRTSEVFINTPTSASWVASMATSLAALGIGLVAFSRRWLLLPTVAAAAATVILLSLQFGALAGARPEAVEQMAALVREHRVGNEAVGQHAVFVRNLVFYLRFPQTRLYDEQSAVTFLQSPARVLLVVREADVARLREQSGAQLRTLGRVRYFNTANVRLRTFVRPDPMEEVENVLLVANR